MGIFSKNKSLGAFGSPLICPHCKREVEDYDERKQVWKLDRWIHSHLARYICKRCKAPIRYEISRYQKSPGELQRLGVQD